MFAATQFQHPVFYCTDVPRHQPNDYSNEKFPYTEDTCDCEGLGKFFLMEHNEPVHLRVLLDSECHRASMYPKLDEYTKNMIKMREIPSKEANNLHPP